jgi:hypothetical protein
MTEYVLATQWPKEEGNHLVASFTPSFGRAMCELEKFDRILAEVKEFQKVLINQG